MEATIVLMLVLAVIGGGMTLMLAVGYQRVEKDRERRVSPERNEPVAAARAQREAPSFFLMPDSSIPLASFVLSDALVRQLEQHVRVEQAVVAQFVHHPSVDSLYRPTSASLHVH